MNNRSNPLMSDVFASVFANLARLKSVPKAAVNILLTALAFIALGVLSAIGWTYGVWQKKHKEHAPFATKQTTSE